MYNDIADIYLEIFPLNQAFLDFLRGYLGNPGSAVLDLGCGPGDYVDVLTCEGYQGVGIDSSEVMITQAQALKQGAFYNLSFGEINKIARTRIQSFDCAYCVGNSLSYLPGKDLTPFLNDVSKLLKPFGTFILQVVNWDKLQQAMSSDFPINKISGGLTFHRFYKWVDHSKVIFHTEIQKEGERINSWSDPLYPKYIKDLVSALQATGLTVSGQFGDYGKSTFDSRSSPALILVAHKGVFDTEY
jgi:SAM-dependent methyltransferase